MALRKRRMKRHLRETATVKIDPLAGRARSRTCSPRRRSRERSQTRSCLPSGSHRERSPARSRMESTAGSRAATLTLGMFQARSPSRQRSRSPKSQLLASRSARAESESGKSRRDFDAASTGTGGARKTLHCLGHIHKHINTTPKHTYQTKQQPNNITTGIFKPNHNCKVQYMLPARSAA